MFDEKDIILRCINHDRKAQKLLYDHFAPIMLGICVRYTGSRDEAEDILQEGFIKVFANLDSYMGKGSLAAWMRRIMINTAITRYYKNRKHAHQIDIEDLKEKNVGECELPELEFTREEMMQVIEKLPSGYRMVFNLFAIEGYLHREIAEMLDIDVNTSKSQFSRARSLVQCRLLELAGEKRKHERKR